jgi:thioredoxin 1
MAAIFTDQNFESEVLASTEPVLVDFWAPWCGPCHALTPTIERLWQSADGFKVGKMNVDENSEVAARYRIEAIPTILVFKNGQMVKRLLGLQPEKALREAVEAAK